MMKITAVAQNKEKRMKRNEDSLRDFWDNVKHTNTCIIGVQKEKRGPEKIFEEIRVKKSPNMKSKLSLKSRRQRESHTR